jgi:hypothetical protein
VDNGPFLDPTYPTRIIIPVVALYSCVSEVEWDHSATGIRVVRIVQHAQYLVAGTVHWATFNIAETTVPGLTMPSTIYQNQQVSVQPGCGTAGDWIELQVYQNSGGNLTIRQSFESPSMMISYIAPHP